MNILKHFKTVLVVAAHPDDELLGCGGTLLKHIDDQADIYILILGTGAASRSSLFQISEKDLKTVKKEINSLKEASLNALTCLGICRENIFYKDFPDNQFDTVPLLEITKSIEQIIEKVNPDIIYTHSESDLNADHKITYSAVLTACRPGITGVKMINSFEIPSSTEFGQKLGRPFIPDLYVQLTERDLEKKLSCLEFYKTEIRQWPFPRSLKGIKCLAEYRGMESGSNYCEAFKIIRLLS